MPTTTKRRKTTKKAQPLIKPLTLEINGQCWLYDITGTALHGPYFVASLQGDRAIVARHYESGGHSHLAAFCDVAIEQLVLLSDKPPALKGNYRTVAELIYVEQRFQKGNALLNLPVRAASCSLPAQGARLAA